MTRADQAGGPHGTAVAAAADATSGTGTTRAPISTRTSGLLVAITFGLESVGLPPDMIARHPAFRRVGDLSVATVGLGALVSGLVTVPGRALGHGETTAAWVLGVLACVGYVVWVICHDTHRTDELTLKALPLAGAALMGFSGAVLTGLTKDGLGSVFPAVAVGAFGVFLPITRAFPLAMGMAVTLVATSEVAGGGGDLAGYSGMLLGVYAVSNGRRGYIQRAMQAEQLVAVTERANAEQAHAATLAERTRVAREIHDVLAHSLAALSVQLEAADALITDGRDVPRAQDYVTRAQRIAREGLTETRRAIAALRDDSAPLPDLLAALAESYRFETEVPATVTVTGDHRPLGHDVGLTLYRTAQEAFTNVRKHAPGASVVVVLRYDARAPLDGTLVPAVELRITNAAITDAVGDLHTAGGGYGLTGMRERAELLSGELTAGPLPDGWEVTVRVPYAADRMP